jgi:hypothetical protein
MSNSRHILNLEQDFLEYYLSTGGPIVDLWPKFYEAGLAAGTANNVDITGGSITTTDITASTITLSTINTSEINADTVDLVLNSLVVDGIDITAGNEPYSLVPFDELGSTAYIDAETVVRTAAPVTITTATYTVTTATWVIVNFAGTCTLTLPNPAQFPGRNLSVKTLTANTVISASSNVEPIDSATPGAAILAATAGKWARLVSDGIDWIIMEAN